MHEDDFLEAAYEDANGGEVEIELDEDYDDEDEDEPRTVTVPADILALARQLRAGALVCNSHPQWENGWTPDAEDIPTAETNPYWWVQQAFIAVMTPAFGNYTAHRIYEGMLDSGEDLDYVLKQLNISVVAA